MLPQKQNIFSDLSHGASTFAGACAVADFKTVNANTEAKKGK